MDAKLAAQRVADRFVSNTHAPKFDPMWLVALAEVIIYVIKYCDQKNDLNSFKNAIQLANAPVRRYIGVGRRTRDALRKAISNDLEQCNCDEMIRAILETAASASDDELLDLIKSVDKVDHNP